MQKNYKNNKVWRPENKSDNRSNQTWNPGNPKSSKKSTQLRSKPAAIRNKSHKFGFFKNIFNYIKIPKINRFGARDKVRPIQIPHRLAKPHVPFIASLFGRSGISHQSKSNKTKGITRDNSTILDQFERARMQRLDQGESSSKQATSQLKKSLSSLRASCSKQSSSDLSGYKVFEPAKSDPVFSPVNLAKNSLMQTRMSGLLSPLFKVKKFQFGFKNIDTINPNGNQSLLKRTWYNINYFFTRIKLLQRFNTFMLTVTLGSFGLFFLYLCFFDTFFLVKDYKVTFAQSSYLSPTDVNQVLAHVKKDKLFGFIPNNQFWYLSSRSVTIAAQSQYPEIDSITVSRKIWPNYAELEIKTEPILVTLGINKTEYWRIGYDGTVVSRDAAGLRENLVVVERPVTLNDPKATLQDYSFAAGCESSELSQVQNCAQLNRFWFVVWIWSQLDQLKIDYTKTSLPSLFDSDVVIDLNSGARLIFDSGTMSKKVQKDRIVSILQSIVGSQVNKGEIKYIDFRQPKKVFLCRSAQPCDD